MKADAAYCELAIDFAPCEFRIKWADSGWEIHHARRLRRAVFCEEQGVFAGDDLDAVDAHAQPLVALACVGGLADAVVGTVRIHAAEDGRHDEDAMAGVWWGSRLAVDAAYRKDRRVGGRIGASLIRLAVRSAHARGAKVFLAHVQAQNQVLFEGMHWRTLKALTLHGRPHLLMQADLAMYPPCHDPLTGLVSRRST
jgi:putative N-acetyltransferase (TIGR04045 family)